VGYWRDFFGHWLAMTCLINQSTTGQSTELGLAESLQGYIQKRVMVS
jgi:hypothetical protein